MKEKERGKVEDAEICGQQKESGTSIGGSSDTDFEDDGVNSLLANIVDRVEPNPEGKSSPVDPESEAADKTSMTAIKHKSWLEARAMEKMIAKGVTIVVPQEDRELERIFGEG